MKRLFLTICAVLTMTVGFAQNYSELAFEAYDQDNIDAVMEYTALQLKQSPKDVDMHALRAMCYVGLDDYNKAIDELTLAIKKWNKQSRYTKVAFYCIRGSIYKYLQDDKRALKDFNQAIKVNKKDPYGYVSRGEYYGDNEQYDKAEADFRKAFELNVENSSVAIKLIKVLLMEDKLDEAEQLLDAVSFTEDDLPDALRLRSYIYLQKGEFRQFVDANVTYLSLTYDDADMLVAMADLEPDHVYQSVTKRIEAATNDDVREYWLTIRTRVNIKREQYIAALEDLDAIQALHPDTVEESMLYAKGECYMELQRNKEAIDCFTQLIERSPEDFNSMRFFRAILYARDGQYQKSEEDYRVLVDNHLVEDDALMNVYYNMACLYSLMNQPEQALDYLRQSLQMGFNDFAHMEQDTDLDNIRELPEYIELVQQFNQP